MSSFTADRAASPDAFERFTATPWPTTDEEIWKYTPIADLDLSRYEPTPVAIDGAPREHLGADERLPAPKDAPSLLNAAFAGDPAVVRLDGVVTEPVIVRHHISVDGSAVFPAVVVTAGENAEGTVVIHETSDDVEAFSSGRIEVIAGDGSNLRVIVVQDLGHRVWQTSTMAVQAGRDATVKAFVAGLGGSYARLFMHALLESQGATIDIDGIYFAEGEQVLDFRSNQDHIAPKTTSSLLLKGAVAGASRGVYSGVITVREGAKGADAFLTNRNLVLSEKAGVDSIPNLEIINENDLKNCGHAAATGPVDEEQLFYLESRGVPTPVAERLIVFGFFDDVLAELPVPSMRELLRESVAERVRKS